MTTTVFGEWLATVNHKLKKESWKNLLFVDIATDHRGAKLVKLFFAELGIQSSSTKLGSNIMY
jgi:hypothetical protein